MLPKFVIILTKSISTDKSYKKIDKKFQVMINWVIKLTKRVMILVKSIDTDNIYKIIE